jgi:FAD/FMN-containing dehydrogenase
MEDWIRLYTLGHTDKKRAFEAYSNYYLSTSGQIYWSDVHQLSLYPESYHLGVDRLMNVKDHASEMISEIYVPREKLTNFIDQVRKDFRENHVNLFYGTIRLIEKDDESYLAWAKQPYACIIFNLHTGHSPQDLEKTAADFRRLIDRALTYGGSYYLTYHRWATRQEVEAAYPQFAQFLELKRKYDPEERFQSDWYRHYKKMFGT